MTDGNPLKSSEYWSQGFQRSGHDLSAAAATVDGSARAGYSQLRERDRASISASDVRLQDRAEAAGMVRQGDHQGHSLAGSGADREQARASTLSSGNYPECQGHLRGGCGDLALQGRALHSSSGVDPLQARAQQGDGGLYPGDRAVGASHLHAGLDGRFSGDLRHGGGGGFGGGLDPIPTSWESGGGVSGSKADLPELPSSASPLQFGDWIHLCGPVMRDLSSMASRWWDLTVRQARIHYQDWKQATPLQRVQLEPRMPEELNDKIYNRTEQRGVHLLLKAVSQEMQQMLVTDRQLTSTAILYRLFVRYQPGGPGENL